MYYCNKHFIILYCMLVNLSGRAHDRAITENRPKYESESLSYHSWIQIQFALQWWAIIISINNKTKFAANTIRPLLLVIKIQPTKNPVDIFTALFRLRQNKLCQDTVKGLAFQAETLLSFSTIVINTFSSFLNCFLK